MLAVSLRLRGSALRCRQMGCGDDVCVDRQKTTVIVISYTSSCSIVMESNEIGNPTPRTRCSSLLQPNCKSRPPVEGLVLARYSAFCSTVREAELSLQIFAHYSHRSNSATEHPARARTAQSKGSSGDRFFQLSLACNAQGAGHGDL